MSGHVYFAVVNGMLKVGHTTDIGYRPQALAQHFAAPVQLLGYFPGSRRTEAAVHGAMKEYRLHIRHRGPRELFSLDFLNSDLWRTLQNGLDGFTISGQMYGLKTK